ncbi:hypothetical protein HOG21_08375 [bacterium]|jgi:hypothetical protein|nr:hypothetical protein [bacterium]
MEYSKESIDRQQKIENMKQAGIICYANNYRGKQDLVDIRKKESRAKAVEKLMST